MGRVYSMGRFVGEKLQLAVKTLAIALTFFNTSLAGDLDASFGPVLSNQVLAFDRQLDGKLLVGGVFRLVDNRERSYLLRLHPDGTVDTTFNPDIDGGSIWAIKVLSSGKIAIGGFFSRINTIERANFAVLNQNGSIDRDFDTTFSGGVPRKIVEDSAGNILIGGRFTSVDDTPQVGLARISPAGELDTEFSVQLDNNFLADIVPLDDGKIIIGGGFNRVDLVLRRGIARLEQNGELDPTFNAHLQGSVNDILREVNGDLVVAGSWQFVDGQPREGIARIHANGSLDEGFSPAVIGEITRIGKQSDGDYLIAGGITRVNGKRRDGIARLGGDGILDESYDPIVAGGNVRALLLLPNDQAVIGGMFESVNFVQKKFLAKLESVQTFLRNSPDVELMGFVPSIVAALYSPSNRSEFASSNLVCCFGSPTKFTVTIGNKSAVSELQSCDAVPKRSLTRPILSGVKNVEFELDAGACGVFPFATDFQFDKGVRFTFEIRVDNDGFLRLFALRDSIASP